MYLYANNLYGWAMCKKLRVGEFKWVKRLSIFAEDRIKDYSENSDYGALLKVDLRYPKHLQHLHKDLPFLPERKQLSTKKLVTTIEDKERYVVHISASKQALNHGLKLTKVHRGIMFKQKAWLKPYIKMNTKFRTKAKNEFERDFFKLMNNSVFGKTLENVRNHRDIKLVTTNAQRKKHVSEPNYHTSKQFSEDLMGIEMNKAKVLMNKPVYLGQAILDISKTLMCEFWYDYNKPKYKDKAQPCYMDTDSFIIHIETEDFYKDIADDVDKWFDSSGYNKDDNRPSPPGISKKVLGMFKDELNGKIMKEFIALRAKAYAFLYGDHEEKKKAKGTRKCVIKRLLTCNDYMNALFKSKPILTRQQRLKSDRHIVYTEAINKIALSSNDDKRIQTFDGITTYPYGTNSFKVCESVILTKLKDIPIKMYY